MKTLLIATQKGGVGKSALVCQLAHYLHDVSGLRVLVIDRDDQGNSGRSLERAHRASALPMTASALFMNGALSVDRSDCRFAVVKADDVLRRVVEQPEKLGAYHGNIKRFMASIADLFDVCLIDCAPSADLRLIYAQSIADFMVSPIQLNREAVEGVTETIKGRRGIERIQASANPCLTFIGILPNMVEQTPVQQANFIDIARHYAKYLIPHPDGSGNFLFIPRRSAIAEAQAQGLPVWELGKSAVGAGGKAKTAARDTWREVKPSFDAIAQLMHLEVCDVA